MLETTPYETNASFRSIGKYCKNLEKVNIETQGPLKKRGVVVNSGKNVKILEKCKIR